MITLELDASQAAFGIGLTRGKRQFDSGKTVIKSHVASFSVT